MDILVGNDFDVRDAVFLGQRDGKWLETEPFATTTFSTMSFDSGDIDNDGQWELFAADMHPYSEEPEIMRQWLPVMETMPPPSPEDGPQVMANVLQERQGDSWVEQAEAWHIPFSGWSWSAQFGDLDQDGLLDLYVVNGMTAMEIFRHLPGDELVEENQAYRNDGGNRFDPAPEWKLNSTAGGRGMSMADFDGDGDLDVLINNLRSPVPTLREPVVQRKVPACGSAPFRQRELACLGRRASTAYLDRRLSPHRASNWRLPVRPQCPPALWHAP